MGFGQLKPFERKLKFFGMLNKPPANIRCYKSLTYQLPGINSIAIFFVVVIGIAYSLAVLESVQHFFDLGWVIVVFASS